MIIELPRKITWQNKFELVLFEYAGVKVRQHAAQGTEVALVLEEEGSYGSLRPELHGVGQHLHGHLIATEIVPHKHHSLYTLGSRRRKGDHYCRARTICLGGGPANIPWNLGSVFVATCVP